MVTLAINRLFVGHIAESHGIPSVTDVDRLPFVAEVGISHTKLKDRLELRTIALLAEVWRRDLTPQARALC